MSSSASSCSNWYETSREDGILYARALALGANSVVLAAKERAVAFIATKESVQGKFLMIIILCFHAAILT